jgi:hypothetical protein
VRMILTIAVMIATESALPFILVAVALVLR